MFKTLKRYPDYEISDSGELRRKDTHVFRKTYPVNGHPKVILGKNTEYISRLVAETFIPNFDDEKTEVKHIDGNKKNNKVSNLEWATHSEIQIESYYCKNIK